MLTRFQMLLLSASGAMAVAAPAAASAASPTPETTEADDARSVFRDATKVRTADGIQRDGFIRIGGIDQWISIRSQHKRNPILLFLHGGPGVTSIPTSYYYMKGWDEFFTVVQWDQRGAGKTYAANDPRAIAATMTIDRMTNDTLELTNWLRHEYGHERIFIAAHSWGTVLGLEAARRIPRSLYAYVGIGQGIDFARSEHLGFESTLRAAEAQHNMEAVRELRSIAPFPDPSPKENVKKLPLERKWLEHFDGDAGNLHEDVGRFSPDCTASDLVAREKGIDFSYHALWDQLFSVDFTGLTRLECPVVFMHGRHDFTCSTVVLSEWYERLQAPSKQLVWFEDSGHELIEEQPGRTLVTLASSVLPHASQ